MPANEITVERGRHTIRCVKISGPAEPEQWYWHLYRDGVRINGGLNNSPEEAVWIAGFYFRREERAVKLGESV